MQTFDEKVTMDSVELPRPIGALFDRYREAFDCLDGDGIARLFAVPSAIVSGGTLVTWPDRASVRANMVALCDQYRRGGYASADYTAKSLVTLGRDIRLVDLAWTIERRDGLPAWQFGTAYHVVRSSGDWRIQLCVAYEEEPLDPSPRSTKDGD